MLRNKSAENKYCNGERKKNRAGDLFDFPIVGIIEKVRTLCRPGLGDKVHAHARNDRRSRHGQKPADFLMSCGNPPKQHAAA